MLELQQQALLELLILLQTKSTQRKKTWRLMGQVRREVMVQVMLQGWVQGSVLASGLVWAS